MTSASKRRFAPTGLITLLSDFGTRDGYVGAMKGVMLTVEPTLRLVDLAHDLPPQDVRAGALALAASAPYFPVGTVHLAVVDPGVGTGRAHLVIVAGGHALVGPDNGLLLQAAGALGGADSAWRIHCGRPWASGASPTFHGRDVFAPAAARLAAGLLRPADAGPTIHALVDLPALAPLTVLSRGRGVTGEVIAIDSYGNCITNIPADAVAAIGPTVAVAGATRFAFGRTYADVPSGQALALVGSTRRLEVAVRDGSAAERLGLALGAPVSILEGRLGLERQAEGGAALEDVDHPEEG